MFCKRKTKGRFEPLFNKENVDFKNFEPLELEKTDCTKRFTMKLPQTKHRTQSKLSGIQFVSFTQAKQENNGVSVFESPKNQNQQQNHIGQWPYYENHQKQSHQQLTQSFDNKPHALNFSQNSREDNSFEKEWRVDVIEVNKPNNFQENLTDFDQAVEKWQNEFEDYDMDSDKENMPPSDEQIDSDDDCQEDQEIYQRVNQQSGRKVGLFTQRFVLSARMPLQLDKIREEDETTNTLEIPKKKKLN